MLLKEFEPFVDEKEVGKGGVEAIALGFQVGYYIQIILHKKVQLILHLQNEWGSRAFTVSIIRDEALNVFNYIPGKNIGK
jgi:hypothetical protein